MYVNWLPVPCRKGCRQQPSVVPLLVPLLYSALRASFSQQCYASARFLLLIHIVLKCPASLPLCIVTYILFRFHSALAVLTAFAPALLLCITFSSAVPISVFLSFFYQLSISLRDSRSQSKFLSPCLDCSALPHTLPKHKWLFRDEDETEKWSPVVLSLQTTSEHVKSDTCEQPGRMAH